VSDLTPLEIVPVDPSNWRAVADLEVTIEQRAFVTEPSRYLALCCYGPDSWSPLAIRVAGQVVGFLMWAVDPEDGACWLGGVLIDRSWQRRGIGRRAVLAALELLAERHGHRSFALSYMPENDVARRTYAKLGFVETAERAEDELVARLAWDSDRPAAPAQPQKSPSAT
jgi:diamine N-acetyltransferase